MADKKKALAENEVKKRIWSQPGGEELALREAKTGTDADVDNQSEAVAHETPKSTLWKISDPRIEDRSILGPNAEIGKENRKKNKKLG